MVLIEGITNSRSKPIQLLIAIAWGLSFFHLYHSGADYQERGAFTSILYGVFVLLNLILLLLHRKAWYAPEHRGFGIEDHLSKAFVIGSYFLLVVNIIYFIWIKIWPLLIIFNLLVLPFVISSFILLHFHNQDTDPTPPGYFLRNLYLK